MPFVVLCPECNAQLKSNALVPAGRTITCPSCKTKFTTERDSKEIGGSSKASVSVPPAPPPKPKAKPSRNDEEDFEDEEDDRPKKKVKASRDDEDFDDEDDRPKKKSKASRNEDFDDDDEDDRPVKKKASKNRDYDDDESDDEDRPRPNKKGKKKKPKKSVLPWILALVGGGGFAVLGILTLVLFLTNTFPFNKTEDKQIVNSPPPPEGGPNNPPNPPFNPGGGNTNSVILDAMRYAPNNTDGVIFVDLEKLRADPTLAPAADKLTESFTFGLFDPKEIRRVGIFTVGTAKGSGVLVLQLKSGFNRNAFDDKIGKAPKPMNGILVYESEIGYTYFGDPTTAVIGKKEIISPTLGKPQTADANIREFTQNATGIVSVYSTKPESDDPLSDVILLINKLSGNPNARPAKFQRSWITVGIKQTSFEITETHFFDSETVAKNEERILSVRLNAAKQSQEAILASIRSGQLKVKQKPDDLKQLLETTKITTAGNKLVITYNQPKDFDLLGD